MTTRDKVVHAWYTLPVFSTLLLMRSSVPYNVLSSSGAHIYIYTSLLEDPSVVNISLWSKQIDRQTAKLFTFESKCFKNAWPFLVESLSLLQVSSNVKQDNEKCWLIMRSQWWAWNQVSTQETWNTWLHLGCFSDSSFSNSTKQIAKSVSTDFFASFIKLKNRKRLHNEEIQTVALNFLRKADSTKSRLWFWFLWKVARCRQKDQVRGT